jgi:aspartyl-tRNA(Asn)/glutamyl-tRNA(Gln) amidotransferase subunit C
MSDETHVDIAEVAELAQLELSEAQAREFGAQLERVLAAFAALDAVDVEGVEPTTHPVPVPCPRRADEVEPSIDRERLLDSAPARGEASYIVPRVISS